MREKSPEDDARAALSRAIGHARGRQVLGVWDTRVAAPQLGAVLILLAELSFLRRAGAKDAALAFVGRNTGGSPGGNGRTETMIRVANSAAAIARCLACTDIAEAKRLLEPRNPGSIVSWPAPELAGRHSYESMEVIQDLYEISGKFPLLELRKESLAAARRLLDKHAPGRTRIAVHLKMSAPFADDMSNADMPTWERFFREVGNGATFVLVGQDPIPDSIAGLGNVVVAERLNASVVDQLCLIRLCDAFMGMASGLCQIAIFGRKPYAVFKNPGHHPEEMARQMRSPLGFSFSLSCQSLIQQRETVQLLVSQYEELLRGSPADARSNATRSRADE